MTVMPLFSWQPGALRRGSVRHFLAVAALLALAVAGRAQSAHAPPDAWSFTSLPDVTLLNERGEKVRFFTDLVKGRVVAINTIFTTCTTICPGLGANFARLSRLLAGSEARDALLISISVDPLNDTPERLSH